MLSIYSVLYIILSEGLGDKMRIVTTIQLLSDDGRIFYLKYYITSRPKKGKKAYGVRIEKYDDSAENLVDSDQIDELTSSYHTIWGIVSKLCSFTVTPISLSEVIDDIVDMAACESDIVDTQEDNVIYLKEYVLL